MMKWGTRNPTRGVKYEYKKRRTFFDTISNVSLEEQAKTTTKQAVAMKDETRVSEAKQYRSTEDTRPEWLPEKFKNAEDLAKAYSELEKKQSTPTEPDTTTS